MSKMIKAMRAFRAACFVAVCWFGETCYAQAVATDETNANAAVQALIGAALEGGNPSAAVENIKTVGKACVPYLMDALNHEEADVRWAVALTLGELGSEAVIAVPALVAAIEDRIVCGAAARALARIDPPDVTGLMAALGSVKPPHARRAAATALAEMPAKSAKAIPALIGQLNHSDFGVRESAAIALARLGPEAASALANALRDTEPRARVAAAFALGYDKPARHAVSSLVDALNDSDAEVRLTAAMSLGRIGLSEANESMYERMAPEDA